MRSRSRRHLLLVFVLALAVALYAFTSSALARPGGGEGYSGGGGHGGGGSGSGGNSDSGAIFELVYWLLRLCIEAPVIGLPIIGGLVIWFAYSAYKQHANKDWDSGPPVSLQRAVDLEPIRRLDPDFSHVVFEDFAFRLFAAAHRARHTPDALAGAVGPYMSTSARAALVAREPTGTLVQQVIVGAQRVVRVDFPRSTGSPDQAPRIRIGIEYEANIATAKQTYFTVEHWLLARDATARSKSPAATTTLPCPNCGAPWQTSDTGTQTCAACGQIVDNGRFDWVVENVALASSHERGPTLTTEVPERGTDLPTYRQRDVDDQFHRLQTADPAIDLDALNARLSLIHSELSAAWSKNELVPVRGLVSDGLFDYLSYWVTAYKKSGLLNLIRDVEITRTELAKVTLDRWYHAVTVRIWATGLDYVIQERTGKVVRGSKRRPRPHSEYWTLIRSAARKGPPNASATCGNCGAPLEVSMAGACKYCNAHVTRGEFDWVLSKIEQDDSYRG
jgi:hypothetical protein